jgi:signal transduction histidine kinase
MTEWFFQRWLHMTLRLRLVLGMFVAVTAVVLVLTVVHVVEVQRRLERDLDAQATRLVTLIQQDLRATERALDAELAAFSGPRGAARALVNGRTELRVRGAQGRLVPGRIDVLKVVAADGTILSSGHWPTSFGALDPMVDTYRNQTDARAHLVEEATPQGQAPALERWVQGASGAKPIIVVAGRFLGVDALASLRERIGAHVLALCAHSAPPLSPSSTSSPSSFRDASCITDPVANDTATLTEGVHHRSIEVGGGVLWVGVDRSGIDEVLSGILLRAVLVGVLALLLAVIASVWAAQRLVQPIESLAAAAARLAAGDRGARVDTPALSGPEVRGLIEGFNGMAADLDRDQQRLLQAERVSAWQEIAQGLAHELKNPLTPILSAMEVIQKAHRLKRIDFDDILQEQAGAVIEEVMRLKELSDAFARFARLPEQKLEPLRPAELVEHALALYARHEALHVERIIDAELPTLHADKTQLMTVLSNLIKNAVEAVMEHHEPKRLRVSVARADDGVTMHIVVEDSGTGIAPEVAERLFTPYVTTKGSRGTGLGLALSLRIVQEHGGTLEAFSSAELGGARFVVRLPMPASAGPTTTEA